MKRHVFLLAASWHRRRRWRRPGHAGARPAPPWTPCSRAGASTPDAPSAWASMEAGARARYGLADLERDVANAADTIFEAGSVSKQFTAAASSCSRAKASCRSTIPSGKCNSPSCRITACRSRSATCSRTPAACATGERSPASPAGRASAPTRTHVLDIVSRQKALNFTRDELVCSNTGYNLSRGHRGAGRGQSFADFSRDPTSSRWA